MQYAWREADRGVKEVSGRRDNQDIVSYLASVGLPGHHDETAWCSAFAHWCMEQASIVGSGKANARSWLRWGQRLARPTYGAVTVLWRGSRSGWQGHVAFYIGEAGDDLILLGGNQGNAVRTRHYAKNRLLGYRWPMGKPISPE